jgi:hypothetical protein
VHVLDARGRDVGLVVFAGGDHVPWSRVAGGYMWPLEVVAAAADSASHPSHHHQYQADDEKDQPDNPQNVDLEQESDDEKDDSKDDHVGYLVSMQMYWGQGQCLNASFIFAPACLVLPLN